MEIFIFIYLFSIKENTTIADNGQGFATREIYRVAAAVYVIQKTATQYTCKITAGNFYSSQTVFALECRFECPLIHQFPLLQLKKHGSKTSALMQQYWVPELPHILLRSTRHNWYHTLTSRVGLINHHFQRLREFPRSKKKLLLQRLISLLDSKTQSQKTKFSS
jgi:hypothetical protein